MIKRYDANRVSHLVVEHNGVLYFGGFTADDRSKDLKGQTEEICNKIDGLLRQHGSDKSKLLTATMYVMDFSQREQMNEAWLSWLASGDLPTRATVGVAELGKGALIEVVVSAAI